MRRGPMKLLNPLMILGLIIGPSTVLAADWNNHALDCVGRSGVVSILTSERTNKLHSGHGLGELQARNWELGNVYAYTSHLVAPLPLRKVSEAKRSVFTGKKKGFGLYENHQYILDLRDTIDDGMFLKSKITGEVMECHAKYNDLPCCC